MGSDLDMVEVREVLWRARLHQSCLVMQLPMM